MKRGGIRQGCCEAYKQDDDTCREFGHRPFFAGTDTERRYCTDCHGNHKIPERQRKWDKETGKLIWRDGYQVE